MKRGRYKGFQRMLAVLFAVAMVVTSIPQTAMTAYAAETDLSNVLSTEETSVETTESPQEEVLSVEESLEEVEETESSVEEVAEVTTVEESASEDTVVEETVVETVSEVIVIEETTVEEVAQPDVKTDGESGDVCTFTFAPDEHVKIYDADGVNEITQLTAPSGSSDMISFVIKVDDGYTVKSTKADIGSAYLSVGGNCKTGAYKIRPGKKAGNVYNSDATITVTSTLIADYTATFNYNADAVELEVLKDGEEVSLTDVMLTIANTDDLSFKLKAKDNYKISNVSYTTDSDETAYTLDGYDDDEDGYYEYSVGRLFENHAITITTTECCQITFNTENARIGLVTYYEDLDMGEGWFEDAGVTVDGTLKWAKNEPVYFLVGVNAERCKLFVSTTEDESGKLTPVGYMDDGQAIYKVTPTEDMCITVNVLPATFPLEYDESFVEDIKIVCDSYDPEDLPVTLSEDKKSIELYKNTSFNLYVKPKSGKLIYSMFYTMREWGMDDEGNDVVIGTYKENVGFAINEEGYYYAPFNTYGDALNIGFDEGCTITFNSPKAAVGRRDTYEGIEETATCAVGEDFTFTVTPVSRYEVLYVTTNGDESGKITPITVEDDEMGESYTYYRVIPTGNMTISVVTAAVNKEIAFVNECTTMYYMFTSEFLESNDNYYYIDKDKETVTFAVIIDERNVHLNLCPNVMLRDNKGKDTVLQGIESTDEMGNRVYSYTVKVSDLTEENIIYISDENAPKKLTVVYDTKSISDMTVAVDEVELTPISTSKEGNELTAIYEVEKGKTAALSAKSGERYSISSVLVEKGTDMAVHEVGSSSYSGEITLDVNTLVTIKAKGKIFTTVKQIQEDGRETKLETIGNTYDVSSGKTYKVDIACGDTPVELNNVYASAKTIEPQICADDKSSFIIVIPDSNRSSSFSVKVTGSYLNNYGKEIRVNTSVRFRITEEIESVTAIKKRDETIVDTYESISYTTNPKKASFANVGVEVVLADGVPEGSVTYQWKPASTGRATLRVCASAKAGLGEVATIRLYRKEELPISENYYINGSEVKINIVEPKALMESKPEAKVTTVNDVSMTLKLDTPYERSCVNGKQYYKVEVTPKAVDGQEIPASILEATAKPFFIAREYPEYDDDGNEIPGFLQSEKLIVNNAESGLGQEWKYDVKVTLVQTSDKTTVTAENASEKIIYSSQTLELGEVATKNPAFAVKLTLQKKASQIYTTQKDVIAANLKYDKYAVCADSTAADITVCDENEKLLTKIENGQLVVSATANTKLGKHTIQVTPYGPASLYRQNVTMTINVVKGIEKIKVTVPSNTIYKQSNKSATLKATVVYNEGSTPPKKKNVKWEIVDETGMALDEFHALSGMLTIRSGQVTVNRKANVSEEAQTFRIKVTAADFAGNTTTAMSDIITVSNQPLQLGEMLIVQKNDSTSMYTVVAQNGDSVPTVTTDKLKNAQLVVLKAGETVKNSYSEEELDEASISASQLTVKTSNKGTIALTKDGEDIVITSGKPAKNIKLTVSTNDGGKKSKAMKVTVGYTTPQELALGIYNDNTALNDFTAGELNASFAGTVNTKMTLKVMQKENESAWNELYAYTNYTVSVSGGKIIASDVVKGTYTVIVSAEKATVTLKDKVNKKTKKYTITNTNYSKSAAPSVKIKTKTPSSIVCGVLADRVLEYTVASKKYSCTDKYVMIESEVVSAAKKPVDYAAFAESCDKVGVYTSVTDGTLKLNFANENIPLGNYKLTLTFGTMTDGKFVADAKPVNITVKVVKAKVTKGSYKATTTYKNVQAVAGTEIVLKGSSKNLHSVTYTNVMGANVKGVENKFLTYFRLEDNKLILKDNLTEEQLVALKKSKTDNYGYLTYTAVYGDNGYGVPYTETKTVKVTITFKK